MKKMRHTKQSFLTIIVTLIVSIGLLLGFNGCSKDINTLGPEKMSETQIKQNRSNIENIIPVNDGKVKLFNFTANQHSLNKMVTQSTWVTPRFGGTLSMVFFENSYYTSNDANAVEYSVETLKAKTTLKVLPGAVNYWVNISITMDDRLSMIGDIDMEFAPHGLVFNTPALLNIEAYNLDLSDIDESDFNTLGIYYYNEETGIWERMECESIDINFEKGSVKVVNAQLPHFSRYAIGSE